MKPFCERWKHWTVLITDLGDWMLKERKLICCTVDRNIRLLHKESREESRAGCQKKGKAQRRRKESGRKRAGCRLLPHAGAARRWGAKIQRSSDDSWAVCSTVSCKLKQWGGFGGLNLKCFFKSDLSPLFLHEKYILISYSSCKPHQKWAFTFTHCNYPLKWFLSATQGRMRLCV